MLFDRSVICSYNKAVMKRALVISAIICFVFLFACKKSNPASPAVSSDASKTNDAVQQKLQELAGTGATDCGRVKSQDSSVVQPASDCAMKAAEGKQAFYVAYDLPGLTTAVAGNAQGNLFSIQAQTADASSPKIESTPCPSTLRLAQSGRVTCYPAGSMGGMGTAGAASPHGGMGMPPATGANPHAGAVPSHGKPTTPK
jgi:hypothetical protein